MVNPLECASQCARRRRLALELSKVMYATYDEIGDFEQDFEAVVEPLGGIIEGWGVKQEVRRATRITAMNSDNRCSNG